MRQANALTAILLGGSTAATLDLIYACIRSAGLGKPAVWTFLAIASGVLPLSAFPLKISYPPLRLLEGFASHALFVGIPIAMAIRRAEAPRGPRPMPARVAAIPLLGRGQRE
jgi:hypothetical protein